MSLKCFWIFYRRLLVLVTVRLLLLIIVLVYSAYFCHRFWTWSPNFIFPHSLVVHLMSTCYGTPYAISPCFYEYVLASYTKSQVTHKTKFQIVIIPQLLPLRIVVLCNWYLLSTCTNVRKIEMVVFMLLKRTRWRENYIISVYLSLGENDVKAYKLIF